MNVFLLNRHDVLFLSSGLHPSLCCLTTGKRPLPIHLTLSNPLPSYFLLDCDKLFNECRRSCMYTAATCGIALVNTNWPRWMESTPRGL